MAATAGVEGAQKAGAGRVSHVDTPPLRSLAAMLMLPAAAIVFSAALSSVVLGCMGFWGAGAGRRGAAEQRRALLLPLVVALLLALRSLA